MLRNYLFTPTIAFVLLSSCDLTTQGPTRSKYFTRHLKPWSDWRSPPEHAVRWERNVQNIAFPRDEGGLQDQLINPVRFPTSRPLSIEKDIIGSLKESPSLWFPKTTSGPTWVSFTESSQGVTSPLSTTTTSSSDEDQKPSLADFGYSDTNGPHVWATKYPSCGGNRQSPININLENALQPPDEVDPALFLKYYDAPAKEMMLVNSGHSLRLTGNWSTGRRPTVSGAVLKGEYALAEAHIHWGEDEEEGSEHFINGQCYPMEMHLVHYKLAYKSFDEAKKYDDGLTVISYLFELQEEKNLGIHKLIEASKQILNPKSGPVSLIPFPLEKLAKPFTRNYASYLGSLTTPPCTEIVTWIINLQPQGISKDQITKLRKLRALDGRRLLKNFRPLQGLNGRMIKFVP